jgi:DNA-binding transcriptional LysR family regulator
MEMHQIRYFLGVCRTLNFTRAAEECNVSQPSLTRAIKLLESELGGDLFRRERNLSHLTDLGQRMLPLMQQCYDTAQGVKSLATAIKKGEVASLRIAMSRTIDMALVIPFLTELLRAMNGLDLKFLRGTADEVAELLKQGDADLALTGVVATAWDRFDARPLFTEGFAAIVSEQHRLAQAALAQFSDLRQERIINRVYCEQADEMMSLLRGEGIDQLHAHEVSTEQDLITMLEGNMGVAIAPESTSLTPRLRRLPIPGFSLTRTVNLMTVAGRMRSAAAEPLIKQLKAADWQQALPDGPP